MLGFFAGAGIMILPSVGPFVALLVLLAVRMELRRSDLLWLGGAVGSFLQVVAGWLIFRAIGDVAAANDPPPQNRGLEAGLLVGMAVLVSTRVATAWGGSVIGVTVADILPGASSPVLFAHSVLVLAG